jgi:serine/threonine-protein kinase
MHACRSCGRASLEDAKFCAHCGVPLNQAQALAGRSGTETVARDSPRSGLADPLIGVLVAERYRIIEQLGRGGMGVVYKAEHASIGKLMALKLLTGELTRDVDHVKRFRREALMASQLSHPNTVQVFDFGGGDGLTYLAMEYLRGVDLSRVIEKAGTLGPVRTAKLMIQVCSSLIEAHEKDIIHRDLKPENIMIMASETGDDVVKVLDFGLAKLRESRELAAVTMAGAILGTPYYMSPEQAQGEDVDQRADVYALGALMHVCLTGVPVFDAPNPIGVLTKQLAEAPRAITERFPELSIPQSFDQIVLRCLRKDRAQRYRTARELQSALIGALEGLGHASASALLDNERLRQLARTGDDAATRGEIERYERKLQTRGRIAYAVVAAVLVVAMLLGFRTWHALNSAPPFRGEELEPNDKSSEANLIPFGKSVQGMLGKRLDKDRSDRDFYRFEVPGDAKQESALLSLELSPLGNMALCAWVYRAESDAPLARFCTGSPVQPLSVPDLALRPGGYLIAVMQDRTEYRKGQVPPVYENVSDWYTLKFVPTAPEPRAEVEPNGQPSSAEMLTPGASKHAALGFARDEDVFCAAPGSGRVSFELNEGVSGARPRDAVLQVTPIGGPGDEIPVRVHGALAAITPSERDQKSPWTSPAVDLAATTPACLVVTLVPNPWAPTPHPLLATPSYTQYSVTLKPSPSTVPPGAAR